MSNPKLTVSSNKAFLLVMDNKKYTTSVQYVKNLLNGKINFLYMKETGKPFK